MPENETLVYDNNRASRWRPISDCIGEGQDPTDLFPKIERQFYKSLQRIWRQWRERGVDAARLFAAALSEPKAIQDLIKTLSFDPHVQLLRDVAVGIQYTDMAPLICDFVDAIWEDAEAQLGLNRHFESQSPKFIGQVRHMLSRIANCLANNPSRIPNCPSRNEPPPDLDTQLGESLL